MLIISRVHEPLLIPLILEWVFPSNSYKRDSSMSKDFWPSCTCIHGFQQLFTLKLKILHSQQTTVFRIDVKTVFLNSSREPPGKSCNQWNPEAKYYKCYIKNNHKCKLRSPLVCPCGKKSHRLNNSMKDCKQHCGKMNIVLH